MAAKYDPVADPVQAANRARRRLRRWRIFAVLLGLALIIALIDTDRGGAYIARLTVEDMILSDADRTAVLAALAEDKDARALIVEIDSPGGTVVGGQDLYRSLTAIGEEMPVVAVMGTLATSAGYMVALPGERIFARAGSLTGSIGVILQTTNVTGLLTRLGISAEAIKSSPLKAQPSPLEPLTQEGRAALTSVIEDMYDHFVDLVATRRGLDPDQARALADGRVYTGRQAVELGLIDEIGTTAQAVAWLATARDIDPDLPIRDVQFSEDSSLLGILVRRITGKSLLSNTLTLDGLVSLWQPEAF